LLRALSGLLGKIVKSAFTRDDKQAQLSPPGGEEQVCTRHSADCQCYNTFVYKPNMSQSQNKDFTLEKIVYLGDQADKTERKCLE